MLVTGEGPNDAPAVLVDARGGAPDRVADLGISQPHRWLRIATGLGTIAMSYFLAAALGSFERFNLERVVRRGFVEPDRYDD